MYNSRDLKLIAERYKEVVSEGIFDRFKKKKPEAAPAAAPAQKEEEMQKVMVFGRPKEYSVSSLMYHSKTIDTIGKDPSNNVELKIYEGEVQDVGSYRDVPIFIPVIVLHSDDYPRPPSIIGNVGKAHESREKAIEELNKLAVQYQPKPKQMELGL